MGKDLGFGVQGVACGVLGLVFGVGVRGLRLVVEFGVKGLEFRVLGLGLRVYGLGFRVLSSRSWV